MREPVVTPFDRVYSNSILTHMCPRETFGHLRWNINKLLWSSKPSPQQNVYFITKIHLDQNINHSRIYSIRQTSFIPFFRLGPTDLEEDKKIYSEYNKCSFPFYECILGLYLPFIIFEIYVLNYLDDFSFIVEPCHHLWVY